MIDYIIAYVVVGIAVALITWNDRLAGGCVPAAIGSGLLWWIALPAIIHARRIDRRYYRGYDRWYDQRGDPARLAVWTSQGDTLKQTCTCGASTEIDGEEAGGINLRDWAITHAAGCDAIRREVVKDRLLVRSIPAYASNVSIAGLRLDALADKGIALRDNEDGGNDAEGSR